MPNWVSNELVLTGPPAALEAALEALGDRESEDQSRRLLNFSQVAPIPATIQSQEPDGAGCFFGEHGDGAMDSECWTVRHWGSTTNALWTSVEGSPAGSSHTGSHLEPPPQLVDRLRIRRTEHRRRRARSLFTGILLG